MSDNYLKKGINNSQEDLQYFQEIVNKKSQEVYTEKFDNLDRYRQIEVVKKGLEDHSELNLSKRTKSYANQVKDADEIILKLTPEEDDDKIEELLNLMRKVGVLNTIDRIQKKESFHILDDFHRFLVQYIKSDYKITLKEKSKLYPGLHMTLYEVKLPAGKDEKEKEKKLEDLLSSMEQFYAGMIAVSGNKNHDYYTIEIANPKGSDQVSFFCAIPDEKIGLFRNQILAIFSNASIKEITDDYNIFNKLQYVSAASVAYEQSEFLPIKTYKKLGYDPINIILQSFSNLSHNEGAAIQIILSPISKDKSGDFTKKIDSLNKGDSISKVMHGDTGWGWFGKIMGFIHDFIFSLGKEDDEKKDKPKETEDQEKRSNLVEQLKYKNSSRLYNTNIRLITSGNSDSHAKTILAELESAYLQFDNPNGNKFKFNKISSNKIHQFVKKYTFRVFDNDEKMMMNTSELTSLFHFPQQKLSVGDILSTPGVVGAQVSTKIKSMYGGDDNIKDNSKTTSFKLQNKKNKNISNNSGSKKKIIKESDRQNSIVQNDTGNYTDSCKNDTQDNKPEIIIERDDFDLRENLNLDNEILNFKIDHNKILEEENQFLKKGRMLRPIKEEISFNNDFKNIGNDREVAKQTKPISFKEFLKLKQSQKDDLQIDKNDSEGGDERLEDSQELKLPIIEKEIKKERVKKIPKKDSKILLGVNEYQGIETPIYFQPLDRMRHMYVIGQTGTGKTTLLKNMIVQDIKNGDGVCFIDPHGSDIEDILATIPEERHDDVIYFDPAYLDRPMGLNMLEFDPRHPEQKSFVINELLSIFEKLFEMKKNGSGGPMFEMYFRNATALAMEDSDGKATLFDIVRVLTDKEFRSKKLKTSKNVTVNQFWTKIAEQAGGDASMENIVPYITSKFDGFLSNDYMRPIITQEKSAFNFREVMDNRKILLINLSKGRLGELNSSLLGLIMVGKILMAALSRVDSAEDERPPFYLYIDEFQNVTTNSISQILSEARKYNLSLNIAHQFIKQIDEGIKDAVFGNVGSMAIFRVGQEDAEFLEKQLKPVFTASDIASIDNRNAYLKMLVSGEPQPPFNIRTMAPDKGNPGQIEYIKQVSYQKYGRDREEVEEIIRRNVQFL